ncbi:MAG: glutamine synthetase [Chloroflexi bacterium]|nr:glutamine synthetase [Chloroflexota bacterium]
MNHPPYALMNPLTRLLDKPRQEFTREDLIHIIEQKQLERITFHYTAIDGKLKELKIPLAGRTQAERILADGERVDGSSLFRGLVDVAVSDLYVAPVYQTAFLNPFDPGSLDFVCRYLTHDGELAPYTLDNILLKAYRRFQEQTGWDLHAMGELEFFVLSNPAHNLYTAVKQRGYHTASPFNKTGDLINEMVNHITQITGAVKYAHSEVGNLHEVRSDLEEIAGKRADQLEIEFLPTPIDEAGDNLVLARWLIRNVAYQHGCVATFTPKLEEGIAGNGLHVHMELRRNGRNAMRDDNGRLSREAQQLIGGLGHYAATLTAFGNTTSSAYLRLVPNQEAPTRICWSESNRSAMIRVPLGWTNANNLARQVNPQQTTLFVDESGRQTVELRSPDGSAMVHLLLAGIAMSATWGLTHPAEAQQLADNLYVTGNIFRDKATLNQLRPLPSSCVASAAALRQERDLYEADGVFPPSMIDYVARMLQEEDDEGMNQYLADLPADDRLHQTRAIMHKDLHRH